MCGIFGAVNTNDFFDNTAFERFSSLNDLTRYRGPDDHGVCALKLKQCEGDFDDQFDVFLGNRWLSILDLSSNGHQPMTDHQGHWIAYNGEIFNYLELRRELHAKRHEFTTGTDTEVILNVDSQYAEQRLDRLNRVPSFSIPSQAHRRV